MRTVRDIAGLLVSPAIVAALRASSAYNKAMRVENGMSDELRRELIADALGIENSYGGRVIRGKVADQQARRARRGGEELFDFNGVFASASAPSLKQILKKTTALMSAVGAFQSVSAQSQAPAPHKAFARASAEPQIALRGEQEAGIIRARLDEINADPDNEAHKIRTAILANDTERNIGGDMMRLGLMGTPFNLVPRPKNAIVLPPALSQRLAGLWHSRSAIAQVRGLESLIAAELNPNAAETNPNHNHAAHAPAFAPMPS